jgi:hypothetical protein
MDREDVLSFLRFLSEATIDEIKKSKAKVQESLADVDPRGNVSADLKFLFRKCDEELLARAEYCKMKSQQRG